jgi:hypothetical protein
MPDSVQIADTLYTRYTFQKNKAYISFYPGWNENQREWELTGNQLTIGFNVYLVDSITDSTLVLSLPGFRRIVLDDENYLNRDSTYLHKIGEFNSEPVFEANKRITPRYKKDNFLEYIRQNLEGYNIKKAITFTASFIVGKDGKVSNVRVQHGISDGFDAEVIKKITATSKDWTPAVFKGEPVQSQMIYTIKYLDSIVN